MNKALRWTLLLFTIGGGFAGLIVVSSLWSQVHGQIFNLLILLILYGFFGLGILSGILLAENERLGLMFSALFLLLQVPFVFSSILVYDLMSGLGFRVHLVDNDIGFFMRFGAQAQLFFLRKVPSSGVGINIVALILLFFVAREIIRLERLKAATIASSDKDTR